eukprot:354519-Chlamydomonas_euryale.AAC.5
MPGRSGTGGKSQANACGLVPCLPGEASCACRARTQGWLIMVRRRLLRNWCPDHAMPFNVRQCHLMPSNACQCHLMPFNVCRCHLMPVNVC